MKPGSQNFSSLLICEKLPNNDTGKAEAGTVHKEERKKS